MDTPNLKQIAQLAKACRKAGIKTFKGFGMEFTLSEELPKKPRKKGEKVKTSQDLNYSQSIQDAIESDSLTTEELLFWSTGQAEEKSGEAEEAANA